MALLDTEAHQGVNAAFMRNRKGAVCIAFSDPAYVRSEVILLDRDTLSIHAILHESSHLLGHVSETMAQAFEENEETLLAALLSNGSVLELQVPVKLETT